MELSGRQEATAPGERLWQFYEVLLESFGPQGWWPARTRWEVIWGAILTQNTAWRNVTLALGRLRRAGLLTWRGMRGARTRQLEAFIRPAGFYRQKARTLHAWVRWLERRHGGRLESLFSQGVASVRRQLLALRGIGPETADAILLYAGRKPVFVADAYTRRVMERHALLPRGSSYEAAQAFLHRHLPPDQGMFNEFHALLVEVGKRYCHRNAAQCAGCPLAVFLPGPEPSGAAPRAARHRPEGWPEPPGGIRPAPPSLPA